METLRDLVPGFSRLAVLWRGDNADSQLSFSEIESAAPALGVLVISLAIGNAAEIDHALRSHAA